MRLIELRLKNLNSLKGEWHIDFTHSAFVNEGIFAITGQTGAGKTTILDAICLALYSQTPRLGDITGTSNEMMTQGTGECSAEVVIEINDKHYRCFWYQHRAHKKPKGNLLAIRHEISDVQTGAILEDAKSKTAPFIRELIGMDFSQFTRSIMLAQGSFAAFLKSESWERAAILEKITGTAIYAQIGKNVFEKKRDKEHELAKLQAGVDSLPLLSADAEAALIAEAQTQHSAQTVQRQALETIIEQLGWLEEVAQLERNLTQHLAAMSLATQEKQDFIPNAQRLHAATQALESESSFQAITSSRDNHQQRQHEHQILQDKIPAHMALLQTARTRFERATRFETQIHHERRDTLPIIASVRKLDAQIQQQTQRLTADNQRKSELSSSIARLLADITTHKIALQDSQNEMTHIISYLSERQALNGIEGDISTFNNQCARIKSLLESNIQLDNNRQTYKNANSQWQEDLSTFTQQQSAHNQLIEQQQHTLSNLQQQQAALLSELSELSPPSKPSSESSPPDIRTHIDQLDSLIQPIEPIRLALQQLITISDKILCAQKGLPDIQQALATLAHSIAHHQSEIKTAKSQRQDQQEHLEALQKVAKLEDYIVELKTGTPCPLCGALEHPYEHYHPLRDCQDSSADRLNNSLNDDSKATSSTSKIARIRQQLADSDVSIDTLTQTLSKLQSQYASTQNQHQNENNQLDLLHLQAQQLCADMQTQLDNLNESHSDSSTLSLPILSLKETRHEIADLAQQFNNATTTALMTDSVTAIDQPFIHHLVSILSNITDAKSALIHKKEHLKTTLTRFDNLTQMLSKTATALDKHNKQQQQYQNDSQKISTDIRLNAQRIEDITTTLDTNFTELTRVIAELNTIINTYPADKYHPNSIKIPSDAVIKNALSLLHNSSQTHAVITQHASDSSIHTLHQFSIGLAQMQQHFHTQKDTVHRLQTAASTSATLIETKQLSLDSMQRDCDTLSREIKEQSIARQRLQESREQQFATQDPEVESQRLQLALDTATAEKVAAQIQLDKTENTHQQLQASLQQLSSELIRIKATLSAQERDFTHLLRQAKFATEADFIKARLPKAVRDTLHQHHAAIEQALNHAAMQLTQTQQQLDNKRLQPLTEMTAENHSQLTHKKAELKADIEQRLGTIGAIHQQLATNEQQKQAQTAQNLAITAQKQGLEVWQQLYELIGSADGKKYRNFAQGLTFKIMIDHANIQLRKMSNRYLLTPDSKNALELNVIDNYQGGDIRSTKNLSGGEGFIISLALALGLSQMASQNTRVDSLFLDEGFGTLDEESLDIALDTLTNLQQEGKIIGIISHVQALKARIFTQIHVKKLSGGYSEISGQGCQRVTHALR